MESPPAMGASRSTGRILRGRAHGNNLNYADFPKITDIPLAGNLQVVFKVFGGLYTAPYFPVGIHWSPYGFLEFMWSPCGFSYSGPTQICVFSWTPARLQLESKSTTWNPGSPPHGPNMESRSTLCKVDK
jgi:hypothetical protein